MPNAQHSYSGSISCVENLSHCFSQIRYHFTTFFSTTIAKILVSETMQKAVIEDTFSDDGCNRLIHVLQERIFLCRILLQSHSKSGNTFLFEEFEFRTIKLLAEKCTLRSVSPVIVSQLYYFWGNLHQHKRKSKFIHLASKSKYPFYLMFH